MLAEHVNYKNITRIAFEMYKKNPTIIKKIVL